MSDRLIFTAMVNDEPVELAIRPNETLLEVLRERLSLTGAKEGCGEGVCGACTVLVNGQPRRARVPDRLRGGDAIVARQKADDGNALQIGAPMPGVISTIMVEVGQDVEAGDVICSIEAMKMETALHAETSGKVAEVCVKRGDQIDAKDLLVRLEA